MKKIIIAALLAGSAAMPASAAFIHFNFYAVGYGQKFFSDLDAPGGGHWEYGWAHASFDIIIDEDVGYSWLPLGDGGVFLSGREIKAHAYLYDYDGSVTVSALFSPGVVGAEYPILDRAVPKSGTMEIWEMGTKLFDGKITSVSSYIAPYGTGFGYDHNIVAPEPASWALMIGGFALAGAGLRRRRTTQVAFT